MRARSIPSGFQPIATTGAQAVAALAA